MKKRKAQLLADGKPVTPMVTMALQAGSLDWFGAFDGYNIPSLAINEYDLKLRTGGEGKVFITEVHTTMQPNEKMLSEVKFIGVGQPPKELIA